MDTRGFLMAHCARLVVASWWLLSCVVCTTAHADPIRLTGGSLLVDVSDLQGGRFGDFALTGPGLNISGQATAGFLDVPECCPAGRPIVLSGNSSVAMSAFPNAVIQGIDYPGGRGFGFQFSFSALSAITITPPHNADSLPQFFTVPFALSGVFMGLGDVSGEGRAHFFLQNTGAQTLSVREIRFVFEPGPTAVTPEPGALVMVASGAAVLLSRRRRADARL